jgi:hypothetical protein
MFSPSAVKNELEKKQFRAVRKSKTANEQRPANKRRVSKKKLRLEGKVVTEGEGKAAHDLWRVIH